MHQNKSSCSMILLRELIATAWILALLAPPAASQSQNPFEIGPDQGPPTDLLVVKKEPVVEGATPAKIVIERVVSFPSEDAVDSITLRNVGGQTQDLTGWTMVDAGGKKETAYKFGVDKEGCEDFRSIPPAQKLEIFPLSRENPCGFQFSVGIRDKIKVLDAKKNPQAELSWSKAAQRTALHLLPDGSYEELPEDMNVIRTLQKLGNFTIFLQALEVLGFKESLSAKSDPSYEGVEYPEEAPPPPIDPHFPAWFGFKVNRSSLPPPPPPPPSPTPKEGVPKLGPYTLLAPDDAAFDHFRESISGAGNDPISIEFMLSLPELKDIVLYHIIPGKWTSEHLKNDTSIVTAKTSELVPFADGAMTEGKIMLHDSCVDKPAPGGFDCQAQAEFGKCYDPFMVSPLGAQWQGGFCQKTCQRCTCDPDLGGFCAQVGLVDVMASNGVIHQISRVMFPPPKFEAEPLESLAESPPQEPVSLDAQVIMDLDAGVSEPREAPKMIVGFKPRKIDEETAGSDAKNKNPSKSTQVDGQKDRLKPKDDGKTGLKSSGDAAQKTG